MPYKKVWPSQDAFIISPSSGFGSTSPIKSGEAGAVNFIGLLQFDLTGIPSNATITQAVVYLASAEAASGFDHTFHRLVREWGETTCTWLAARTGVNWGTAGAKNTTTDYNSTSLGTMTHPASGVFDSLDVTATVQNWVDGTNSNYGFRISSATATQDDWHSREGATKSLWPYMEVFYTVPAIGYAVNATSVSGGIRAEWQPMQTSKDAAGPPVYSAWYRHFWRIGEMEMTDWLTLHNLRGTALTGITTTNYDTPNVAATYATGRLMSVSGRQQGRQMLNVVAEFLVDETS